MAQPRQKHPTQSRNGANSAVFRVAAAVGIFGVLWTAVPRFDAWQRARFAERLADHAEASTSGVARLAVRRLANSGRGSLAALVRLAGSANADAADAAQRAVLSQLTAWETEFRTTRDVRAFAERLDALSTALADHAPGFSPQSRAWAERIALRIVADCDRLPASDAVTLLAHCDRALSAPAAIPAKTVATMALAAPSHVAAAPVETSTLAPRPASGRVFSTIPMPSAPAPGAGAELRLVDQPLTFEHADAPAPLPETEDLSDVAPVAPQEAPAMPHPRPLPRPEVDSTLVDVPSPQMMRLKLRRYRQLSDRELSRQSALAEAYDARAIEQVIRERKLPNVPGRMEGAAAAPRPAVDRVLAERVSQLPPAKARILLRALVVDPTEDAETRLQALTMLATSGDPQLAAIARDRALEDADPRVAELATQILRDSSTK